MRERQDRPAAKKFFQAVGLLALALVSVYIIVQCFVIFRQSYKTETAIRYTMAESVRLSGVVAFDSVDVAGSGNLGYLVQDGERVTNGTVVAECYTDDEQGVQRERLDRLERTITLLTKSQNSTGSELSVLTNQTRQSLYNLLDKLDTAQYGGISEAEDDFLLAQNRLQISTGQTAGFSQTIAALQEEYDGLKSQLDTLQTITAATNGYFSSTAASPSIRADRQALDDADPAALQTMLQEGFPAADADRAGQITTAGFPPRKTDDLRMYWEWLQYFSARPGREEYYDWAVVRYWKIFYQFWCQSDAAGNLPEVRPKFMAHKKHLDAILPDILASKYLPLGEKLRAAAFCASPTLTYGAAAAWGRLHTRKGK